MREREREGERQKVRDIVRLLEREGEIERKREREREREREPEREPERERERETLTRPGRMHPKRVCRPHRRGGENGVYQEERAGFRPSCRRFWVLFSTALSS